jgi:translation initiation factor IF-2
LTQKIRIFALAKELGVDSKELIEYCNRAGIELKNSALASISPDERDMVVGFMEQERSSATATATQERPRAPVRDTFDYSGGKVREIKAMPPRPQVGRARPVPAEEEAPAEEPDRPETPAAEPQRPPAAAEQATPVPVAEQPAASEEPAAADESTPAAAAAEAGAPGDEAKKPEMAPIRRGDYVPASGTPTRTIREMRPQGTVPESELRGRRARDKEKDRGRPGIPSIAAPPPMVAPKPRRPDAEGPAQKPVKKLTPGMLGGGASPLGEHLRKSAEQKDKKKKGDRTTDIGGKRPFAVEEDSEGRPKLRPKRSRAAVQEEEEDRRRTTTLRRRRQRGAAQVHLKTEAEVEHPITIRALSEALGRPAKSLMKILFERGQMVTINETLTEEDAIEVALELGVDLRIKRQRDIEEELVAQLDAEEPEGALAERPPIVTILGHVDHGKTTLLDKLRETDIAAGEAGGITQHIRAYQVEHNGKKVTFVDTPGHAAFGEMRARGANVTDIVVLVVAADDGVMPQTVECISHARAAEVPMVVALNKIDLPDVNVEKALQGLAANNVLPAEWGGEVEVVRTSGATGKGLDDLLETILVTAELHEFKANPGRPAYGACLEAFRDEGRGVLAWVIVQNGTLRVGDVMLCGSTLGRVRAIYNDRDEEIAEAPPSTPVRVAGLNEMPNAGDHFFVMADLEEARQVAAQRLEKGRAQTLAGRARPRTLDDILTAARGGAVQDLPLILKADTPGSLEALKGEVTKLQHPEVRPQIVHEGVGGVNESDVYLASASGAIIIAFHVIPEDRAETLAEREGVDIRRYNIIYEVTDHIKRALEGLLMPERVEVATGRALVLQTFDISRFGRIAGCRVLSGTIERNHRVRLIRDQKILNDFELASLRREKDDVREVREGFECGIRLAGFNDIKEGDLLEAYRIEEVKRKLD